MFDAAAIIGVDRTASALEHVLDRRLCTIGTIMVNALVAAGLPQPIRQHPVALDARLTVHLDLAYPQWRIDVEVDHPYWHDPAKSSARDKERDRRLTAIGWRVVRVTNVDFAAGLTEVMHDLRDIIALAS